MKKGLMRILVFLVIGIWLGFPQNGFSQTETQQTAAYTLGEIVVTGERVGVESIGTVREITDVDIARRHVQTLDQALELLPGLDIRTGTDGVPRVDLRGFRSRLDTTTGGGTVACGLSRTSDHRGATGNPPEWTHEVERVSPAGGTRIRHPVSLVETGRSG